MTSDAKRFLSSFYLEGKGWLEIRVLDARGRMSYFEESVDRAIQAYEKWLQIPTANVYFGVCPRKEEGKHNLKDVMYARCIWTDLDAKNADDRKKHLKTLREFPLPPTIVVNSGNGFHAYWLLNKPTRKWAAFDQIIKALEKLSGADKIGDRARILRVPGTFNTKDPSNPLPVRILPRYTDYLRVYALRDLALIPKLFDRKLRHKIVTGDVRGFESRSERDWDVMTALVRLGFTDDAIQHIFMAHSIGDRARDDEKYFDTTLAKARERRDPLTQPFNVILKTKATKPANVAPLADPPQDSFDDEDEEEEDTDYDWGFIEGDDARLYRQNGREPHMVSTFVFDPLRLLKGDSTVATDAILGNIRTNDYTWNNVILSRRAFTKSDAMLRELPIAAWQWLGGDADVKAYLPYLMDVLKAKGLPHTRSVSSLGRHKDIWVSSKGAISATEVFDQASAPAVYHNRTGLDLRFEYFFPSEEEVKELKRRVSALLPKINVPSAIWPMIGWYFAAPYKPSLSKLLIRFPTLNVWGTQGSGKTSTIIKIFLPLAGDVDPSGKDCQTTRFVLLSLLGATSSIPIAFSEFRQSAMTRTAYQQFLRYLLQAYDTGRDSRGRPDQTVQHYPLTSPFSVDGEDAVADPAARQRIIAINLVPEDIQEGSPTHKAFQSLSILPLRGLAGPYVQHTLSQDVRALHKEATTRFNKAFPGALPDRVRNNYIVTVLGILSYTAFFGTKFPNLRRVLEPSIHELVNAEGRTSLIVDEFIEDVINAVGLRTSGSFFYKYNESENVLRFHLTTALRWWFAKRRREGGDALRTTAIKQQLKERHKSYAVEPKGISVEGATKWMYGIDLSRALAEGLDIPETLPSDMEITVSF